MTSASSSSQNVELEAAKFLHKLIQDSTDEPAKLATKLYVILQHMKASGKEHSMPYQVISRAMETVINQHGLDIEALKSSRIPLSGGAQTGSSQANSVAKDSNTGLGETEVSKVDLFSSGRPPVGSISTGHDYYQGSATHRSSQSFDHESPSSLDSRSANSQSLERRDDGLSKQVNQKDGKMATTKRKRGDTSAPTEEQLDIPQSHDTIESVVNTRKGKMSTGELPPGFSIKGGESVSLNAVPSSGQMEYLTSLSGSMRPRFSFNVVPGNVTTEGQLQQLTAPSPGSSSFANNQGNLLALSGSYHVAEPPAFSSSLHYNGTLPSTVKTLEHGGNINILSDANKIVQVGRQNSTGEVSAMRSVASRDTSKSPIHASASSGTPFKEQQLKQLRAQCLVFLAFRNGLLPKKIHLEIALGNISQKEENPHANIDGPLKDFVDHKGKAQSANDASMPFGRINYETDRSAVSSGKLLDADPLAKESESLKMEEHSVPYRGQFVQKVEPETQATACLAVASQQSDSGIRLGSTVNPVENTQTGQLQVGRANPTSSLVGTNKQNSDISNWTVVGNQSELSRGLLLPAGQPEIVPERKDTTPSQFQNIGNNVLGNQHTASHPTSFGSRDSWKHISAIGNDHQQGVAAKDAQMMQKHVSREQVKENNPASVDFPLSPKYTMSERWIMDKQKKKLLDEQTWTVKQQKARAKIASSFHKLKANVSSSEDISAKTKSVIELKKLQLLELQRRLRGEFLNDFFKPINTEMDHTRSFKKHRHGRRIKQIEKYEQKMKEERQKRMQQRQKEFFGELEIHKERLDDALKIKRERWKGVNKYVKEFHKRKERIHREKIDRIQREKINLLKINDVEGYLRMVQDAKSDRVKQLLKETEKYLQKLGSKLQDAKALASRFEHDMNGSGSASVVDKSEPSLENEDESDQAKHYMESNEKYYFMAHSIKESVAEQPSFLQGGKLREYQMNGLRWLVSLYNNHLNGILADEMGLGKTVQVISLICYLMETKNDRGPFLVVVPSSVLPGWESEINFWAPTINRIVYSGPPEERRKLFKERIVQQKFNVLLTTYEYLMNKHDRPKLSKIHWHYIIIDEGHRIKNASCKLNAELKHYQSSHRLLLTGTPLQNNLEELWALLNFLLPNIFNSSDDFSLWFNKPFESNGDSSADQALLSEEENLLIINRLHQVLRPFVLRRLKHKVENELPEKIERLVRCEASGYQKLLMKRVEENLGSMTNSKARSVHNSVMELRNICNHPYLSQLHVEEVDNLIPKHYLPPIIRLCGKLEMLDRLLPKLKATNHRVLFFSTMTRLLDVMEEYLSYKQYRYLRLDGHTSGGDRGSLIDMFNKPDSPFFIFLLSIRAGGVGVNLQAADTVIIFDTDWNPQVDLQAQARAHRIGQKREVLVLRFETVQTVEEQVRAAAEHKLGVANQSITAGFFDNNTSAEDRREYLESLLRESKKEEAAPVLDDDALNDLLARSESEIDVFESVDKQRREEETASWRNLACVQGKHDSESLPAMPSRLVTDDDLKEFYEAMKKYDVPKAGVVSSGGMKRKGQSAGGPDTQRYGRGKRAREVCSYEEQWTEDEFEKLCQAELHDSPEEVKEEMLESNLLRDDSGTEVAVYRTELPIPPPPDLPPPSTESPQKSKEITPPAKRGRGRPKRAKLDQSASAVPTGSAGTVKMNAGLETGPLTSCLTNAPPDSLPDSVDKGISGAVGPTGIVASPSSHPTAPQLSVTVTPPSQMITITPSAPTHVRGKGRKTKSVQETPLRRGKRQGLVSPSSDLKQVELSQTPVDLLENENQSIISTAQNPIPCASKDAEETDHQSGIVMVLSSESTCLVPAVAAVSQSSLLPPVPVNVNQQNMIAQSGVGASRRRGKKQVLSTPVVTDALVVQDSTPNMLTPSNVGDSRGNTDINVRGQQEADGLTGLAPGESPNLNVTVPEDCTIKPKNDKISGDEGSTIPVDVLNKITSEEKRSHTLEEKALPAIPTSVATSSALSPSLGLLPGSTPMESSNEEKYLGVEISLSSPPLLPSVSPASQSFTPSASTHLEVKKPGRKAPNRAEAPRHRGRKQATTLPAVPGGSSSQDLELGFQFRDASAGILGSKATSLERKQGNDGQELAHVIQSQTSQVHDSDPKRKEQQPSYPAQNKQASNSSSMIDSAAGSSDKSSSLGRIQTANVNDVARVMKEVFSGTRLSKAKISESLGREGRASPRLPVSTMNRVGVTENQNLEDKTCSGMGLKVSEPEMGDLSATVKGGMVVVPENVDSSKSLATEGKNVDCLPVGSLVTSVCSKGSPVGKDSLLDDACNSDGLTVGNESVETTCEAGPVGGLISQESEQILEASQSLLVPVTLPEQMCEKVEQPFVLGDGCYSDAVLSEQKSLICSKLSEESECEAKVAETSQVSGTMLDNISENMDCEAKVGETPHNSETVPKNVSGNMDQPLVSLTRRGGWAVGLSEAQLIESSDLPEKSESAAKEELQCEAKVSVTSQICDTLPGNVSENMDRPLVTLNLQGYIVAGLSEPVDGSKLPEELQSPVKDIEASQVSATIVDQPPITLPIGCELECSGAGREGSCKPLELMDCEAKVGNNSQVNEALPGNASEDLDSQPSTDLKGGDVPEVCGTFPENLQPSSVGQESQSDSKGEYSDVSKTLPDAVNMDLQTLGIATEPVSEAKALEASQFSETVLEYENVNSQTSSTAHNSESEVKIGDAFEIPLESENMDGQLSSTVHGSQSEAKVPDDSKVCESLGELESTDLRPTSIVQESEAEANISGSFRIEGNVSSGVIVSSKTPVDMAGIQTMEDNACIAVELKVSHVCETLPADHVGAASDVETFANFKPENMDLQSSSIVQELGSDAKADQACDVDQTFTEVVTENIYLQPCSFVHELKSEAKVGDASPVCEIVLDIAPENMGSQPSSRVQLLEFNDKVSSASEVGEALTEICEHMDSQPSSTVLELESEVNVGVGFASHVCETALELISENMDMQPSSTVLESESEQRGAASEVCVTMSKNLSEDMNVQLISRPPHSESSDKVGEIAQVCEMLQESECVDLQQSSTALESEPKVGEPSQVCEILLEPKIMNLQPSSGTQESGADAKVGHVSEVHGRLPEPEIVDLQPSSTAIESEPKVSDASQGCETLPNSEKMDVQPSSEAQESNEGDISQARERLPEPEIVDLQPSSTAKEFEPKVGDATWRCETLPDSENMDVQPSSEAQESDEGDVSQVRDTLPEPEIVDLQPSSTAMEFEPEVGDATQRCETLPDSENMDVQPYSEAQDSDEGDVSQVCEMLPEPEIVDLQLSSTAKEFEPKVGDAPGGCETLPDSQNMDVQPSSEAQESDADTEVGDVFHDCKTLLEPEDVNLHQVQDTLSEPLSADWPPSSSAQEYEGNVGGSSQVCVTLLESKSMDLQPPLSAHKLQSEAEVGDTSLVSETLPESLQLDLQPSSTVHMMEFEAKIDEASQVCDALSVSDNMDLKLQGSEILDLQPSPTAHKLESESKVDETYHVCDALPESENMDLTLQQSGTTMDLQPSLTSHMSESEAKVDEASQVCNALPESERMDLQHLEIANESGSEAKVDETSQVCELSPESEKVDLTLQEPGTMDLQPSSTTHKSESEAKVDETCQPCDALLESEKMDLTSQHSGTLDLQPSSTALEPESEAKVDEAVPDLKFPSTTHKSESETKVNMTSQVCDALPEPGNMYLTLQESGIMDSLPSATDNNSESEAKIDEACRLSDTLSESEKMDVTLQESENLDLKPSASTNESKSDAKVSDDCQVCDTLPEPDMGLRPSATTKEAKTEAM